MLSPQPVISETVRVSPVGIEQAAQPTILDAVERTFDDGIERLIFRGIGPDQTTYWHERLGEIVALTAGVRIKCIGHVYRVEDAG